MIYIILGMSAFFIVIGFLVTEENAKYLLSGYNTMTVEERQNVDIKNYIPFFRNFHIFLGLSFGLFGMLIYRFFDEGSAGIFIGIYPILAYTALIWKGRDYSSSPSDKKNKIAIAILIAIAFGVVSLFYYGYKENEISFNKKQIEISGMYGKIIGAEEIAAIDLIEDTPKIKYRSNGFALGTIRKGYFKTENGETVLLILNSFEKPLLLIKTKAEHEIYYAPKEKSNKAIFEELKDTFPHF